jgi:hypothetical protein
MRKSTAADRKGTVMVMIVLFLMVLFAFAAILVDLGYLSNAKAELQRAADSAAMAACWDYAARTSVGTSVGDAQSGAEAHAAEVARRNDVCKELPGLDDADIRWGRLTDFYNRNEPLDTSALGDLINAVEITVRRSETMNGEVPFFFGGMLGHPAMESHATATAAIVRDIRGFRVPDDGDNLDIIPFALDEWTWDLLLGGTGGDEWTWNPETKSIQPGPDAILEVNLYPYGSGPPGNRGTVDIGGSNNSTSDIERQILHGISPSDLAFHGGTLAFDDNGELILNGDTGLSAGFKDALEAIRGKPRIIPLFREVHGPGNNADYTIVRWVGIRILEVKLTGPKSGKRVIIQPAPVVTTGVVPAASAGSSNYVYSPVVLVR